MPNAFASCGTSTPTSDVRAGPRSGPASTSGTSVAMGGTNIVASEHQEQLVAALEPVDRERPARRHARGHHRGRRRLLEPAGHLHAGVAAQERHEIEAVVNLAPELEASAIVDPAVEALEVEAERNGGEVLRGEALAGPEIGIRIVHLDCTGRHRVETFGGRDQLASAVELDLQAPARHVLDAFAQVFCATRSGRIERGIRAVEARHLPVERGLSANHGRRGHGPDRTGKRQFAEITTTHDTPPPIKVFRA